MTMTTTTLSVTALLDAVQADGALSLRDLRRVFAGVTDAALNRVLAKLVKAGTLTRTVRTEYDKQRGTSWKFGGAGVCIRHRAYYGLP